MPFETGDTVGAFELVAPAASGGMSTVWRAVHRPTGTPCAVKLMDGEAEDDPAFAREVVRRAAVRHPNIVGFLDAAVTRGVRWLALEWLDAVELDPSRVADWETVVGGLEDVLSALMHAHANGLLHSDLKPGNLMVCADGRWVVIDFGIGRRMARQLEGQGARGTPAYAAPEQIRDQTHLLRPWTDLYSLGAVIWHLVTGHPPFSGTSAQLLQAHLGHTPGAFEPQFPVPVGLEAIVRAMLAKAPWDRPEHAVWVLDAIRSLEGTPRTTTNALRGAPEPSAASTFDLDAPLVEPVLALDCKPLSWPRRSLQSFAVPDLPSPPPASSRSLNALARPACPRPASVLHGLLTTAAAQGRPVIRSTRGDLDADHALRCLVRWLSAEGNGLTLYAPTAPVAVLVAVALALHHPGWEANARHHGLPDHRLAALADGLRQRDPGAVAEVAIAVSRDRPLLFAAYPEDGGTQVALALQEANAGAVCFVLMGEDARFAPVDLDFSQAERAHIIAQKTGDPPEVCARWLGPRTLLQALTELRGEWIRYDESDEMRARFAAREATNRQT